MIALLIAVILVAAAAKRVAEMKGERDEANILLGLEMDRCKKRDARIREMQEMNDGLADCIVRLVDQLERKERDPLGLGFHAAPTWKRS